MTVSVIGYILTKGAHNDVLPRDPCWLSEALSGTIVYLAADRLNALYRFSIGDARQAIEDCWMSDLNDAAYTSAWEVLDKNIGSPLYIIGAFTDERKIPSDTSAS